jgi:hypothetical protein
MTMCQDKYDHPGHRSYGDNLPGYAQGAFFPGDEPGTRCRQTGEACPGEDSPECSKNVRTEWLCPVCQTGRDDVYLWKMADGMYFCRECDNEWQNETMLAKEYTHLLTLERREQDALEETLRASQEECRQYNTALENVRKAVEFAA